MGLLSRWNPDKHLRIRSPRLLLALRMAWYSMVASSVAGFLVTLPFLLDFRNLDLENITQAFILAVFFGVGTALFQRFIASILLGAAMAVVTGRFPDAPGNPRTYRFVMGCTAAAVLHLFAPARLVSFYVAELSGGRYAHYLETLGVIAVYAGLICLSQIMAAKHLRERARNAVVDIHR